MPTRHRGEQHFRSKLTAEDVAFIRHPDNREMNNAELARRFGVERSTIRLIRENVTWHDPNYVPFQNPFFGAGYKKGQRPPAASTE